MVFLYRKPRLWSKTEDEEESHFGGVVKAVYVRRRVYAHVQIPDDLISDITVRAVVQTPR